MIENKPRILYWDLETSYCKYAAFGPRTEYIPYGMLLEPWHILTIAYMWEGDKKPTTIQVSKYGDDKKIVKQMRDLLEQADVLIHHNGDSFDLKKFTARLIYHRLPPLPKITTIDTKKEFKKVADDNYNHLDHLARNVLKLDGKIKNVGGLWMDILQGDMSALNKMAKYNAQDVKVLRDVYLALRPYFKKQPTIYKGHTCQCCGSDSLQARGKYTTKSGLTYQRYCCRMCGSWSRETTSNGKISTVRGE